MPGNLIISEPTYQAYETRFLAEQSEWSGGQELQGARLNAAKQQAARNWQKAHPKPRREMTIEDYMISQGIQRTPAPAPGSKPVPPPAPSASATEQSTRRTPPPLRMGSTPAAPLPPPTPEQTGEPPAGTPHAPHPAKVVPAATAATEVTLSDRRSEPPQHAAAASIGDIVISTAAPLEVAKTYGQRQRVRNGIRTLHRHREEFLGWTGAAFQGMEPEAIRAELYHFLAKCKERDAEGKLHKVNPKPAMVSAVLDALAASAYLDAAIEPPVFFGAGTYPAAELIACRNVAVHWPSGNIIESTPAFFTVNALDFDYSADAAAPMRWLRFLDDLWPGDMESIACLQEIFGLMLISDTSFQKLFLLVGPKRSGKGTLMRILARLIGIKNTAAPTLSSLGGDFGLQPLIHKTAALIGDARIGLKTDTAAVAERLLSVSGEDLISVPRKFLGAWHGTLKVRFVIVSNELPRFSDVSGALASRFVILSLKRSFYGQEDLGLLDRLLPELGGILIWALDGLRRLKARGYFIMPKSSQEQVEQLDALASPMIAFLRDAYQHGGSGDGVLVDDFCAAWRAWCQANHRDHPGTNQSIGLALQTAMPHVETKQIRSGERGNDGRQKHQRWFVGIKPRQE